MSKHETSRIQSVELLISNILRYGVLFCTGVIGIGLLGRLAHIGVASKSSEQVIASLLRGELLSESTLPQSYSQVIQGVKGFQADTVMAIGIAFLISLPVIRVGTTLILFILERDWAFMAITSIVFSVLIVSLFLS